MHCHAYMLDITNSSLLLASRSLSSDPEAGHPRERCRTMAWVYMTIECSPLTKRPLPLLDSSLTRN